jgi:hypothetical protein
LTAAIIIAAVVIILSILLLSPLKMIVNFHGGKLRFEVKYLFLTLFPFTKKEKKERKKRRKKKKKKSDSDSGGVGGEKNGAVASLPETEADIEEEDGEGGKTKRSEAEIVELIKSTTEKLKILYGSTSRGVKHLLMKLAIEDLDIHFVIASDEAAKTAVYYGAISAAVYNAVAFLRPFTTIYIKDLEIIPDFDGEKSVFDISFAVTIKVSRLLSSGVLIGMGILRDRKKYKGFLKK